MKIDKKTIMIIGAHHDDNETIAGGTAEIHIQAGWKVISVVVTNGKFINGQVSDNNIKKREQESLDASAKIGWDCVFLHFQDGQVDSCKNDVYMAVLETMRKHQPGIVITHPSEDYHLDHMATSECVSKAVIQSWNPTVKTKYQVCHVPLLYHGDAWFVPFSPDEYVDISDVMKSKLDLLRCHSSQLDTTDPQNGGMIEQCRLQNSNRGMEAGTRFAEAFRLVPHLSKVRLNGLLGD